MGDWFDKITPEDVTQTDHQVDVELQAEAEEKQYDFGLYLAASLTTYITGAPMRIRSVFEIKNEFMKFYRKFRRLIKDCTFDDTIYATSDVYKEWRGIFHDNVHMVNIRETSYFRFASREPECAFIVRFNFSRDFRELMAIIQLMSMFYRYDRRSVCCWIFNQQRLKEAIENIDPVLPKIDVNWNDIIDKEKDLKVLAYDEDHLIKIASQIFSNDFVSDDVSFYKLLGKYKNYLLFWDRIKKQKESERFIASLSPDFYEEFRITNGKKVKSGFSRKTKLVL